MKKKKNLALLTAGALVCAAMSGCGGSSSGSTAAAASAAAETAAAETTAAATTAAESSASESSGASGDAMYDGKVILGHSSWIGYVPLNIADDMGFFDNHGADVDIQAFESKADSRAAVAAGRIQGMSTTLDAHVMSVSSGMDIQVVLAEDTSSGGDGICALKSIPDFPSLKGHTIAMDTTGGASYFWTLYLMKQNNMKLEDVTVQNMSSGDAGAAFVAGQVDAAATWEPWLSRAKETENGTVLVDSSDYPGIIVDALAMDSNFVKQYPGTVKAIVQGWYDALDYIKTNPEDAYKIMMKYTGDETTEALEGELAGVTFYDKAANEDYYKNDIMDICKSANDLWLEYGLIENEVDPSTFINDSFIGGTE